jgi:hypothetical protein
MFGDRFHTAKAAGDQAHPIEATSPRHPVRRTKTSISTAYHLILLAENLPLPESAEAAAIWTASTTGPHRQEILAECRGG